MSGDPLLASGDAEFASGDPVLAPENPELLFGLCDIDFVQNQTEMLHNNSSNEFNETVQVFPSSVNFTVRPGLFSECIQTVYEL